MGVERKSEGEPFLARWSRRKIEAREAPLEQPLAIAPEAARDPAAAEAPELPPVDELTIDSDFRGFFHPKVDEDVRRSALRKLFSDPHFNVMDGLDVYIDDYSISEPIPPEMLAGLKQAQRIIQWAENREDPPEEEAAEGGAALEARETPESLDAPCAAEPPPAELTPAAAPALAAALESPAPVAKTR